MKCVICRNTKERQQQCCRDEFARLRTKCNRLGKLLDDRDREIAQLRGSELEPSPAIYTPEAPRSPFEDPWEDEGLGPGFDGYANITEGLE